METLMVRLKILRLVNKIRRIKSERIERITGVKVDLDEHIDSSLFEKISNWELESSDFTWKEEG